MTIVMKLQLKSLSGCLLSIGAYPFFKYDATGGGGIGEITNTIKTGIKSIHFNKDCFNIPAINYKTTKLLGFPLPPGLEIKVITKKLEGTLNEINGEIVLNFEAYFQFSIANWIKAPDLIVKTSLNCGEVSIKGRIFNGMRIQKDKKASLVGLAIVPKCGNLFLDIFLGLPNEAFARLNCEVSEFKEPN